MRLTTPFLFSVFLSLLICSPTAMGQKDNYDPQQLMATPASIHEMDQLHFRPNLQLLAQGKIQLGHRTFKDESNFKDQQGPTINYSETINFKKTRVILLKMAAIIPFKTPAYFTKELQLSPPFISTIFKGVQATPIDENNTLINKTIAYLGKFQANINLNELAESDNYSLFKDLDQELNLELGKPSKIMLANFSNIKKLKLGVSIPHINVIYKYYPYSEDSTLVVYYKAIHFKSSFGRITLITQKALEEEKEDVLNIVKQIRQWK